MKTENINTEKVKTEVSYLSVVILRVMLSLIFIVASINHLTSPDKIAGRMDNGKFGFIGHVFGSPEIAIVASGIGMIVGGLSLMFGFKTRYAAMGLIAILIPITLTVQVGQAETLGPLFKNIAILGGLIFFTINNTFKSKQL